MILTPAQAMGLITELQRDLALFKDFRRFASASSPTASRLEFRISAINQVLESILGRDGLLITDESIPTPKDDGESNGECFDCGFGV